MDVDYYRVLGLPRVATTSEIKARYKQLAKQHHPDRSGDNRLMSRINRAYGVLSDPQQRFAYNQTLSDKAAATAQRQAGNPVKRPASRPASNVARHQSPQHVRGQRSSVFSPVGIVFIVLTVLVLTAFLHPDTPLTLSTSGSGNNNTSAGAANQVGSSAAPVTTPSSPTNSTSPTPPTTGSSQASGPTVANTTPSAASPACQTQTTATLANETMLRQEISQTERQLRQLSHRNVEFGYGNTSASYTDLLQQLSNYQSQLQSIATC